MKNSLFLIALMTALVVASCKSNKDSSKSSVAEPSKMEAKSGNSDLILSFYSPGNGVDRAKLDEVTSYLKSDHPDVAYTSVSWGKEGEKDLCFDLSTLSAADKQALTSKLKEMVSTSSRVRVKENEPCREAK
ncbi:MAG: hypothetical protein R2813_12510 [Flavobacteriales bacterium]